MHIRIQYTLHAVEEWTGNNHNYTLPFWCTEHWSSGKLTVPAHMACAEYQNVIIIIPFISD